MKPTTRNEEKSISTTERSLYTAVFLSGLPAVIVALTLTWTQEWDLKTKITITLPILLSWFLFAWNTKARLDRSLLTLSNILTSLREGDYSLRARLRGKGDALADLTEEVNRLGDMMKQQRRNETEATLLLTTVMQEIDVALLAVDDEGKLRLANPAALRLLDLGPQAVLGKTADELGIADCLEGEAARLLVRQFPGATGRWGLRRTPFFAEGKPHTLLVIADLSRTLREEELAAWQRLVRVLSHEINNSLTPIKSIAGSLRAQTKNNTPSEDLESGLGIIESRADALGRFIEAYARLAKLPAPIKSAVNVLSLLKRIRTMDTRVRVEIGPVDSSVSVLADPVLLDQALINLLRNAVDAALAAHETAPHAARVALSIEIGPGQVDLLVEDNGFGPPDSVNLFVPFFTTKPGGSGIGLVLAQKIIESHGGTLSLVRIDKQGGCRARISLPD